MQKNEIAKAMLFGLGLDGKDGHVRITKGPNFRLYGGSQDTHACMQEKAIKFNEELSRKKKTLEQIGKEEFFEIAEKIGLKKPAKSRKG